MVRAGEPARRIVMLPQALEDLEYWVSSERKVALRVLRLIEAARRHPFDGIGRPEPLKHIGSFTEVRELQAELQLRLTYERGA